MDYLDRLTKIAAQANLSEKETELFFSLTNPLYGSGYDFVELYHLFLKLIKNNQGDDACNLYVEKQKHFELEPSAHPELEDDVRIG